MLLMSIIDRLERVVFTLFCSRIHGAGILSSLERSLAEKFIRPPIVLVDQGEHPPGSGEDYRHGTGLCEVASSKRLEECEGILSAPDHLALGSLDVGQSKSINSITCGRQKLSRRTVCTWGVSPKVTGYRCR